MEERLGVSADERQRRAQLVADGGDKALAQLLQRADRGEVAEDRGRPERAAVGSRCPEIAARDAEDGLFLAANRGFAIGDRRATGEHLGERTGCASVATCRVAR